MAKLSSCSECQSFLPSKNSTCPNCGGRASVMRRRLVGPLATLGGGVLAMTLSACYGAADDWVPPDATPDARTDATMDTGTADTGTADTGTADTGAADATPDAAADAASDASGDAAADAAPDA
jgi:hypothetical protein